MAIGTVVDLERYCAALRAAGLDAPWSRPGPLIEPKRTRVEPWLWRWTEIEPLLRQSADFLTPARGEGAERRILRLMNPGVPERTSGHTISVAVQYLLPGEVAPAHRHSPNAIRFMLRGEGAYTTVEGEKCAMHRGDVVLTPAMTWHDHGNEGREPVIWLDALDAPVVRYIENLVMEPYPADRQPIGGHAGRVIHYPWEVAWEALSRLAEHEGDPFDDVIMEYRDPMTGRSLLPTIGCYLQLLRPGVRTRSHRQSSMAVYHVFEGAGATEIEGECYEWGPGDFFVVPPWARHAHAARGERPAILFSLQDVPLLRALGQYREET
ncbi:MAG: cupin domain-containing protein [Candidatus Rokubacteria bacterium]|nr:cupin domain-containing protein [Candidatus Rokubacteria bacterium]